MLSSLWKFLRPLVLTLITFVGELCRPKRLTAVADFGVPNELSMVVVRLIKSTTQKRL